jgi:hypothetical protein
MLKNKENVSENWTWVIHTIGEKAGTGAVADDMMEHALIWL